MALAGGPSPVLAELPIHLDCTVTEEIVLGTHIMVLGEVDGIHLRRDVGPDNPRRWSPRASVT